MIKKTIELLQTQGIINTIVELKERLYPSKINSLSICEPYVKDMLGLEIGGPSNIFSEEGLMPLYPIVGKLDNCNFSGQTIWEGRLTEGNHFQYSQNKSVGYQYISEATDLKNIEDEKYNFLLSSHVIEHTANPLRALSEWVRVVKDNGLIVLIIPNKDGTFDQFREVTSLEHLIEDFKNNTDESDTTHLQEILDLHDLSRDPEAGDFSTFAERCKNNSDTRCLHQHVFNLESAIEMVNYIGLSIISVELLRRFHIVIVAKKQATKLHSL